LTIVGVLVVVIVFASLIAALHFPVPTGLPTSQVVTTPVATTTVTSMASFSTTDCPGPNGGPDFFSFYPGFQQLTDTEFTPYNHAQFINGELDVAGSLNTNSTSQFSADFTSSTGVEVFVFCAPTSSAQPFQPPAPDAMTGYVFSSGAAYSVNFSVTLPAGSFYVLVIDPANSASTITLQAASVTPVK
jgi:hypothetical protein